MSVSRAFLKLQPVSWLGIATESA